MHATEVENGEEQLEDRAVVVRNVGRLALAQRAVEQVEQAENRLLVLAVEARVQANDGRVQRLGRQALRGGREQERARPGRRAVLVLGQAEDVARERGVEDLVEVRADKGRDRGEDALEDLERARDDRLGRGGEVCVSRVVSESACV